MNSLAESFAEAIALAESELSRLSMEEVQTATALTWAARAIVSYRKYIECRIGNFLMDAIEYHHEALEHAATATPGVLEMIRPALSLTARAAGVEK
jgi:hypothetical protein